MQPWQWDGEEKAPKPPRFPISPPQSPAVRRGPTAQRTALPCTALLSLTTNNAIKIKRCKKTRSKTFNEFTYLRIFKYCLKSFFFFFLLFFFFFSFSIRVRYAPPKTSKPLFLLQQKRFQNEKEMRGMGGGGGE